MSTHLVIPDPHAKPGVPNTRALWVGELIADVKPDVVIMIGDLHEFDSLCSYDRDAEEELWARFKAAQDTFFQARNAAFAERDAEFRENAAEKEKILAEAERLLPVRDVRQARQALRVIQERWEAAGMVPRDQRDRLEGRLRKIEEAVRTAEENEWRRTNPEARARAEATVSQLRTSIEQLEKRLAQARDAGREKDVKEAEEALTARRAWLEEAERTLAEFS